MIDDQRYDCEDGSSRSIHPSSSLNLNQISPIKGLVSTIIPVYNRPVMLVEAVESVLNQTYRDIEIIVVNDGSTDETPAIADQLKSQTDTQFTIVHQSNRGSGLAREAGRQVARGEFIQYLDSDDLLLPLKFELQVAGLNAHPECGVSYGKTRYRQSNGSQEQTAWKGSGDQVGTMFPSFLLSRWWDTPTPLYRSRVCDQAGPWTNLRLEEDWEYDCRIASLGVRLHYCDQFVAEVRDHQNHRLCRGEALDASRLYERSRAHQLILAHAIKAGINEDSPEMQHFARELFLLSRQCGAAGLVQDSRYLFSLARKASGETRGNSWDFKLYGLLAAIAGWSRLGKVACYSDSIRK